MKVLLFAVCSVVVVILGTCTARGATSGETNAPALVNRAVDLLNQKRYEDARALLDQAIALQPDFSDAYFYRSEADEGMEQLDKSRDDATRSLELRPKFIQAWFQRSRIHWRLQHYDQAIRDCEECIRLDPKFWQAFLGRAWAYSSQRKYPEALEDADRVVELNPDWVEAYELRGDIYKRLGDEEKALENRQLAAEKQPNNARLHFLLGNALRQLDRYAESIPHFTRALELDPADAASWKWRGAARAGLQRWEEAIADYTELLRLQPQNEYFVNARGLTYLKTGKPDKALDDFYRAIRMVPDRGNYYVNRGQALVRLGRLAEAMADFDKAVTFSESEADPMTIAFWRGEAHLRLNEFDKADADFRRALGGIRPGPPSASPAPSATGSQSDRELERVFQRGRAHQAMGLHPEAIDDFSRIIAAKRTWSDAWENRGNAHANLKQWALAVVDYNEAIQLQPALGRLYSSRCWYQLCLGKMDAALKDALKGLTCHDLDPKQRWYFSILAGNWQQEHGKLQEAKSLLKKVEPDFDSGWPAPVIQFLLGKLTFKQLHSLATNDAERTEAIVYAGWTDLLEGRMTEGRTRLQWVVDYGDTGVFEHQFARQLLAASESRIIKVKP